MATHKLYTVGTKVLPSIEAKIFLQDPLVASHDPCVGLAKIQLDGEAFLGEGPTTSRVAVVDYDADEDLIHPAVRPLARGRGFAVGRAQPAGNFKFHQTNVWAIITRTLNLIETPKVLGRRVPWSFAGGRLLVFPHAGYGENAYYDRESGALHFFYFDGPAGRVYTCLSHDIITHELGHAVLDGIKPYYNELDGPDVAGFHEYFGDALAMVSALTMEAVLKAVVKERSTELSARNLVSDIALEFGTAVYGDGAALRSGANNRKMTDLSNSWEEHDYSEVLSGVFFDVLREFYKAEIPRALIARKKSTIDGQVAMHALISAARQTRSVMLRGIDYCPPVGLAYEDYAKAVIRADEVAYPIDERDYRITVAKAFRRRGVISRLADVTKKNELRNIDFREYDLARITSTPTDAYVFLDANRELLGIPRSTNFKVISLYRVRKQGSGGYYPPREHVIEYVWSEDVDLDGKEYGDKDGETVSLWCGGTLIFDGEGNVLHHVIKLGDEKRKERLRKYIAYLVEDGELGDDDDELALAPAARSHRIATRVVGGRLRGVRNPALRHEGRRR